MLDVFLAAIAGFASFVSPCVLPLIPAYIGYMGGRVTHTVASQVDIAAGSGAGVASQSMLSRFNMAIHGTSFVAGFTFVFVTLGILGTAFVRQIGSTATVEGVIGRLGGLMIIFLGLHFMGLIPSLFERLRRNPAFVSSPLTTPIVLVITAALLAWGFTGTLTLWNPDTYVAWTGSVAFVLIAAVFLGLLLGGAFARPGEFWNRAMNTLDVALYADTRRQMDASGNNGYAGSALLGVVFAAGWTPCIGPTLGAAMMLAANSGEIGRAAILMTAYSLGMGIPFILTALMFDSAQGGLRRLNRHMGTIKLVAGGFLVITGVAVASGQLASLSRTFSIEFGDFSYRLEQCTVGIFEGDIELGQFGTCIGGDESFEDLRRAKLGADEVFWPGEDYEVNLAVVQSTPGSRIPSPSVT